MKPLFELPIVGQGKWDGPWLEQTKNGKEPTATRHLNRQVLCGCCKFKCCQLSFASVEVPEEWAERNDTPTKWPHNGQCRYQEPTGCRFGEDRPAACQLFPMELDFDGNKVYVPFWVITHCPTPKDFVFVGVVDGKYVYRKRDDIKGPKKNNIQDEIRLDHPIEQWPNVLEANQKGLALLYNEEMVGRVRNQLESLNASDEGFFKPPGNDVDERAIFVDHVSGL